MEWMNANWPIGRVLIASRRGKPRQPSHNGCRLRKRPASCTPVRYIKQGSTQSHVQGGRSPSPRNEIRYRRQFVRHNTPPAAPDGRVQSVPKSRGYVTYLRASSRQVVTLRGQKLQAGRFTRRILPLSKRLTVRAHPDSAQKRSAWALAQSCPTPFAPTKSALGRT